jgi:hypothetical protein
LVYYNQNDYPDALKWMLTAYKVFIAKLSAWHPDTKDTLISLEDIYAKTAPHDKPFEEWMAGELGKG